MSKEMMMKLDRFSGRFLGSLFILIARFYMGERDQLAGHPLRVISSPRHPFWQKPGKNVKKGEKYMAEAQKSAGIQKFLKNTPS